MEYLPETSKVVFCDYSKPERAEIVKCLCLPPRDEGYSKYPGSAPVPATRYADLPRDPREIEVVLIKADSSLTIQQMIEEIEKDGSRPATYEEAWSYVKAFFASYPVCKTVSSSNGATVRYYDMETGETVDAPKPEEEEAFQRAREEWKKLSERIDLVILGSKIRLGREERAVTIGKRHHPLYGDMWLIDTLSMTIWQRLQGGYIPVVRENFHSCIGAPESNSKQVSAQAGCWQPAIKPWHRCCQCTGW